MWRGYYATVGLIFQRKLELEMDKSGAYLEDSFDMNGNWLCNIKMWRHCSGSLHFFVSHIGTSVKYEKYMGCTGERRRMSFRLVSDH